MIRHLNELFAEEIEAAVRYIHLATTVKGIDRLQVRKVLLDGIAETIEHAQVVGEKILRLGGVPDLDIRIQLPAQLHTGEEALRTALEFEQAALDGYGDLLDRVKGHVTLEDFARAQIEVESEHVAELRLMIGD